MASRFRRYRSFAVLVVVLCIAAIMPRTLNAAEPPQITGLVTTTSALTADQRRQVSNYSEYWSAALMSDDADQVRRAKRRLLEPLRSPGIRRIFRDEYARSAVPELVKVIDSQSTYAAVNAIQVAAEFPNEAALTVMRDRCDSNRETRWQIRLWASRGIGHIASAAAADEIPPRTIDAAVRDITRAGQREEHWLVLQRQFEALAAISTQLSRDSQVALLSTTLDRMTSDTNGPSLLIQPIHRSLVLLRTQYLDPNLSSEDRRNLGTAFAPQLGRVFEIGMMHWDSAQVDEEVKATYNSAIGIAESVLELVDTQVRGQSPRTAIENAWVNNNRSTFEADMRRWQNVLGAPPYSQP